MWHMDDVGWMWWVLMSLGMVAFWGLLIYAAFWLARGAGAGPHTAPEPPGEVLKRRLAAGEITVEEYERLRDVLGGGPPSTPREPSMH